MPDDHMKYLDRLASSLFAPTSAFAQERERPQLVIPEESTLAVGRVSFTHSARISTLIDDALAAIEDDNAEEAIDALEEIRDLIAG